MTCLKKIVKLSSHRLFVSPPTLSHPPPGPQFADLLFKTLGEIDTPASFSKAAQSTAEAKTLGEAARALMGAGSSGSGSGSGESDAAAHKAALISHMTQIMGVLDDKAKLVGALTLLAQRFAASSVGAARGMFATLEVAHFKLFGDVFLRCLMSALSSEFTVDVREAWSWLYSVFAKVTHFGILRFFFFE